MGIFAAMWICAAVWGEGILRTSLGSHTDHSHPAFWVFMIFMIPGMVIGFLGGVPVCILLQKYADWQLGVGNKPSLRFWFANFGKNHCNFGD